GPPCARIASGSWFKELPTVSMASASTGRLLLRASSTLSRARAAPRAMSSGMSALYLCPPSLHCQELYARAVTLHLSFVPLQSRLLPLPAGADQKCDEHRRCSPREGHGTSLLPHLLREQILFRDSPDRRGEI